MKSIASFVAAAAGLLAASPANAAPVDAATASTQDFVGFAKKACALFKARYPTRTFYPGSAGYNFETQVQYWTSTNYDTPQCVFVPEQAEQISFAVTSMTLTGTHFAVRGGGHMPVPGYNSIDDSGILLSMSNLTAKVLSSDKKVVSVGPGNRWRDVYAFLKPQGLCAVGGRVGAVGVPGFELGGGISFYSAQYGFGSDNIVKYQCVLANGNIVEPTAGNQYSDLFWALKGGGNSFCIVTRFDMKTVVSPQVFVGIAQYDASQKTQYLDAVYNFGKYGALDAKAAIIPTILTFPAQNLTVYAAAKFYDSQINNPKPFENFTVPKMTPVADSYALQPLSDYITVTDALQPYGLRQRFNVMSSIVQREAVDFIHDTFIREVNSQLRTIPGLQASVTFQPIPKSFLQQSINAGGNPQGVDVSKAPYFWMVENWTWQNASDDATVNAFADKITDDINRQLKAKRWDGQYLYMNDAGKGQPIFQNYPPANLARLKQIRAKYDPYAIYTILMPGGWKVLGT